MALVIGHQDSENTLQVMPGKKCQIYRNKTMRLTCVPCEHSRQ